MTPQDFIAKFPDKKTPNFNCLTDIACPRCGERTGFRIEVKTMATFHDDGCDDYDGLEWDQDSYITCRECGNVGEINEFTIDGLDEALSQS